MDKKGRFAAILVAMLTLLLANVIQSTATAETNDQIYLKDGSIMKGTILELTQTTCRIRTAYGVFDIARADILRIESGTPRPMENSQFEKQVSQQYGTLRIRCDENNHPIYLDGAEIGYPPIH